MSQANIAGREQDVSGSGLAAVQRANRGRLLRPVLMVGGVLVVVLAALFIWLFGGRYISTDDSYVDAAKVSLSTDVSGLVDEVYVHDNQHVVAGQPLFSLGQSSYAIAVAHAKAEVAQAVEDINGTKRAYEQALAQLQGAAVQVRKDQADVARYAAVVTKGGVTRAMYDDARYTLEADQDRLAELQQAAGQQLTKLQGNPNITPQETPQYQQADADLQDAERNLAHTIVKAPYSGTVTQVEQLQRGMFLPAGTAAFGLVSDTDVFVTAQPKEDQLTWVRPGQSVDVSVDAYPGQHWKAEVESISPASGSEFSILPAQNSSGNWVKVVQRIPVRIKILSGPTDLPLLAGMSAEVSIDTNHHRHLSDLF
ncbi:HlyD family secretion protein [Acidocella sp.]|uniref:HlyD family secretion protein n=1 Tax=Acidocella sp. TaxID=50710 RepID=UPI00262EC25A|nr:HlyD family secretion protein [Acidocella sp.]